MKVALPASLDSNDSSYSSIAYAKKTTAPSSLSLQVDITMANENLEVTAAEAAAQKLEQNALPIWHMQSTIGTEKFSGLMDSTRIKTEESTNVNTTISESHYDKQENISDVSLNLNANLADIAEDDIAAYYNSLSNVRTVDEDEDEEEDEDEDEDEDEVFKTLNAEFQIRENINPFSSKRASTDSDGNQDQDIKRIKEDNDNSQAIGVLEHEIAEDDEDDDEFEDI